MPKTSPFSDHIKELLAPMGNIRVKAMFGAFGVWYNQAMIALIADERLFLRVDEYNKKDFSHQDALTYESRGKVITLPYIEIPAHILKGPHREAWILKAYQAALRAQAKKRPKRKPQEDF